MATVTVFTSRDRTAAQAAAEQQMSGSSSGETPLKLIGQISQASDWILTHPIESITNTLSGFAALVTGNGDALHNALGRLIGWTGTNQTGALKSWVQKQLAGVYQSIFSQQQYTLSLIRLTVKELTQRIHFLVSREARRRMHADRRQHAFTVREIRALNSRINHEAASAYRAGFSGRLAGIARILDYLGAHNDVSSRLIRDAVSGVLDLASVDDPLARIALSFLLKHVIDKLGIDRLAGDAARQLLAPLTGSPRPSGLSGVIRDLSDRLGAAESFAETFWTHGGSDVEQAGQQWSALLAPGTDIALLAWLGQAYADPSAWARELLDVTEPVMSAAADVMHTLIKEA